ncbi:hypothetical protein T458_19735 [Brevibacillus panacihumi W25]|uniref:Uncharacterized protein n=1 Tax=Brevibacillus panacihumi W25 TaxID=1408254 RepID=V6M7K4_9BACL|nr:hypothetical protein [Brevibacillus panacihumi]EST53875.1 hypothetical protein T458_19735 [Brevibacillus panacihumi W25]
MFKTRMFNTRMFVTVSCSIILVAGLLIGTNISQIVSAHDNSSIHPRDAVDQSQNYIVCVDNVSSSDSSDMKSEALVKQVQTSIEKISLEKQTAWKSKGLDNRQVEVKKGCSFSPSLLEEGAAHPIYTGFAPIRIVDKPSPERLGIFIVDESVIQKHFEGDLPRFSPEEMICISHECEGVTRGIYLSAKEITNVNLEDFYQQQIMYGLGLVSMTQDDDPEIQKKRAEEKEKEIREMKENSSRE